MPYFDLQFEDSDPIAERCEIVGDFCTFRPSTDNDYAFSADLRKLQSFIVRQHLVRALYLY